MLWFPNVGHFDSGRAQIDKCPLALIYLGVPSRGLASQARRFLVGHLQDQLRFARPDWLKPVGVLLAHFLLSPTVCKDCSCCHCGARVSCSMAEEGDLQYKTEYAKSNRSSCKACKGVISKETLRMARMVQAPNFDGKVQFCVMLLISYDQ